MLKSIQLHTRLTRKLIAMTVLLLLAFGIFAIGLLMPVQAAAPVQGQAATPTPATMMDNSMMGSGMMSTTMSMAEMGAIMDQMMATMPVSGTMPMADIGMMMQMMGMMQMHMDCMHMMMGAKMSGGMMDSMMGKSSGIDMPSDVPFDAMFLDSMIEHHQGAIAMADIAMAQAEHEEIRMLAEDIIAAQNTEIEQMQEWRSEWYPDLAPTGGRQMGMGEMIGEDESVPFDQRFMEAMISHHQGAIDMAEMALEQAEHEEIRILAEAIITAQKAEIEQMQSWLAEWYEEQTQTTTAAMPLTGTIWVANEEGHSLSAIDAATNAVLVTLVGIPGPHNVQVSPDGATVWAVSSHEGLAVAVDSQSYALLGTVPVGNAPAHVVVSPDGTTAYVSNSNDNTVTVLDTSTFAVRATVPVGDFPHGLRPSPDGQWVAVANLRSNTVSLIDTAALTVSATVEVGVGPVQVAFAPDGATLYVTLNGEDAIAVVDLATETVRGKVAVGDGPVQTFVTPDVSLVLVANQGTEETPGTMLSIIDAATLTEVGMVETGRGAHGVVVEPSGRYAYVTNLYGDDVAVVDLVDRQVVATVPTGASPNGISFSPIASVAAASPEVILPIPTHETDTDERAEKTEEGQAEGHDEHH